MSRWIFRQPPSCLQSWNCLWSWQVSWKTQNVSQPHHHIPQRLMGLNALGASPSLGLVPKQILSYGGHPWLSSNVCVLGPFNPIFTIPLALSWQGLCPVLSLTPSPFWGLKMNDSLSPTNSSTGGMTDFATDNPVPCKFCGTYICLYSHILAASSSTWPSYY